MFGIKFIAALGILMLFLFACSPSQATIPPATLSQSQPSVTLPQVAATISSSTATATQLTSSPTSVPPTPFEAPQGTLERASFPLSEPGPQVPGRRTFSFQDPARGDRLVEIMVWYPSVPVDDQSGRIVEDAPPDLTYAPYPIILSSAKSGGHFAPHLVSYGFVVVGIKNLDTYEPWDQNLIDQPLDILFTLHQVAAGALDGLEDMIDADRAGVLGYSFDGYNSLALSGARIDPKFYLEQCANASSVEPPLSDWRVWYFCDLSNKWDEFKAYAGSQITEGDDGLWEPMTDQRILAVMPMAPEGAWLFGERGLAAVDRPILIIAATEDKGDHYCPYDLEAVYIFDHLGTSDRFMVSFIGEGHMMIGNHDKVSRMQHFTAAFFGFYLQGRDEYAEYFSEDFINQHDDLAWGVYTGE